MKKLTGKILDRVFIRDNYLLKIKTDGKLDFVPGQFVNIEIDGVGVLPSSCCGKVPFPFNNQ